MSGSDRAAEAVARKLAEWRYEHGADCEGLDKHQWADKYWMEFTGEARTAILATLSLLPEIAVLEPWQRHAARAKLWDAMGAALVERCAPAL